MPGTGSRLAIRRGGPLAGRCPASTQVPACRDSNCDDPVAQWASTVPTCTSIARCAGWKPTLTPRPEPSARQPATRSSTLWISRSANESLSSSRPEIFMTETGRTGEPDSSSSRRSPALARGNPVHRHSRQLRRGKHHHPPPPHGGRSLSARLGGTPVPDCARIAGRGTRPEFRHPCYGRQLGGELSTSRSWPVQYRAAAYRARRARGTRPVCAVQRRAVA
jgi:hypothetical protein